MAGSAGTASETTPLPIAERSGSTDASFKNFGTGTTIFSVMLYGIMMIVCSSGLINFNKYLVSEGRFPFPMHLILIHSAFCSSLAGVLYLVQPSFFPSLTDPMKKVPIDGELLFRGALPIAFMYTGNLLFSNMAYLYSSVAFLQMMKEGNVVFIYCASLATGLEIFRGQSFCVLIFIMMATIMNVEGEIEFSLIGFTVQALSQAFEVVRIILQSMLLSGKGKLDALSYVLVVMPLCFLCLAGVVAARMIYPDLGGKNLQSPEMSDYYREWPLLLVNACLAFVLNVSIALFIKHSSAVAVVLAGLVKDAMVVLMSVGLLHEAISNVQWVGFSCQLAGVGLWSMMKAFPNDFDAGFWHGLQAVLLARQRQPTARKQLPLGHQHFGSNGDSKRNALAASYELEQTRPGTDCEAAPVKGDSAGR